MNQRSLTDKDASMLPQVYPSQLGVALDDVCAGLLILDDAYQIIFANSSMARFSGLSLEAEKTVAAKNETTQAETTQSPIPFISVFAHATQHAECLQGLQASGYWCGQIETRLPHGVIGQARLVTFKWPERDGQAPHTLALLFDLPTLLPLTPAAPIVESAKPGLIKPNQLENLRQDLIRAISGNELVLHYQPKINMRSGKLEGVEALIRWQHPEHGLMYPGAFLPQLEHDDLIVDLGNWVIRTALAQISIWQEQGLSVKTSVNVSARQLQRADFVDSLRQHLVAQPDVTGDKLEIEILESAALENTRHVQEVMAACRDFDVGFSLDDFGTGYSSLAYLRAISADVLKIDRSFVNDLLDDPDDLLLVEGVISLAKAFRREVVAEGVENAEQGLMLMRLGCNIAQGFGIAKPMPADLLPGWLATYKPPPEWLLWAGVPWEMEDFPLLVAKHDHISWVKRVLDNLEGDALRLQHGELTDHHKCRFGHWYYGQGRERYGHLSEFVELEEVHAYVHKLGPDIVRLHHDGRQAEALALAKELIEVRDDILKRLDALQHSVVNGSSEAHTERHRITRDGEVVEPRLLRPATKTRKSRQPLVYIVDDTPANIELLAAALSPHYAVRFSTSGAKVLELLEKPEKPDLILLDVMMPEMDGYEVCRRLKDNPTTRHIPVIFITAKTESVDQVQGFNLGAVDYIPKPFEVPVVLARVRTHLNLKLRTDLLEAQASIDALTGIANRRRFDEVLRSEWQRAARNLMPLSLLMLDVDHFKPYNDHYGHGAGDDCLRQVGVALQQAELRPGDFVARYGGEEFVMILPNCRATGARAIAERIRASIEALHITHAYSSAAPVVTISVGCVSHKPAQGGDISAFFIAADQALYRAKQEGRNRICSISL